MSIRPCLRPLRHRPARPFGVVVATLIALLLAGSAAWAQGTTETLDLAGPVAAMEEYRWYPGTTERALFRTYAFDEAGVITERVVYLYSFRDGSLRLRQVTLYDAGQRLALVVYDADDQPSGQIVYRYDGAGRLAEEVTVDGDGVETQKVVYEHDAAGNIVRVTQYRDGALDRTVERDYDGDGGLLEERRLDAEGRLRQLDRYLVPGLEYAYEKYDEEGEVEATGRGIKNAFGRVLIEEFDLEGELSESYAWTYDERGRVLERRSVYDDGGREDRSTYVYEDDDRGNWVRQTTFESYGGEPELYEIHERTFTYR